MAEPSEPPFVTKDGTVLTQELLDELVAEAERGYDVEKLVPRSRDEMLRRRIERDPQTEE